MSITVTPIGVNGAFSREGFQTNFLLQFGKRHLLIDCGTTAATALRAIGWDISDIESVYISHLHLDHIGGLYELGIKRYHAEKERPALYLHESIAERIWNNYLSSMMDPYLDRLGRPTRGTLDTFFDLRPITSTIESDKFAVDIRGLAVRLVPVTHIRGMHAHGVLVDDRVLITTDTIFDPSRLDWIANHYNLEGIFHDCSFTPTQQVLHATYDELCSLPEDLGQVLYCTHYEDWASTSDKEIRLLLAEAGKSYTF